MQFILLFEMMFERKQTVVEYVWIDGKGGLRSKTKVFSEICDLPNWNFDASSTGHIENGTGNTEGILKPRRLCKNPLRKSSKLFNSYLVFCDVYDIDDQPMKWNNRMLAMKIFDTPHFHDDEPWYGLEQEYFMFKKKHAFQNSTQDGNYYCGVSLNNIQRTIVDEHLEACIYAGLTISGTNAEVSPNQWEFQIGPCLGIDAGDQLWIARFLLERIAEKYDVEICYHPKPFQHINGSGCHTNFSTKRMRNDEGLDEIYKCIDKLEKRHTEHINIYGEDNQMRLSGMHETSPYNVFSFGVGTRNTSIRIGYETFKEKKGYFEDRRPASNSDPYLVISKMYETCCCDSDCNHDSSSSISWSTTSSSSVPCFSEISSTSSSPSSSTSSS